MNVAVVGANGQIGKQVVGFLMEEGHTPRAIVRKEEQVKSFEKEGVEAALVDLEGTVD